MYQFINTDLKRALDDVNSLTMSVFQRGMYFIQAVPKSDNDLQFQKEVLEKAKQQADELKECVEKLLTEFEAASASTSTN